MLLKQINITNFRNIIQESIAPSDGINVIVGDNGSGKTSVLESIYYLSLCKSFRTKHHQNIVNHESKSLLLFAKLADKESHEHKLGIERLREGDINIKFDGAILDKVSEIASKFCVQFLSPDSFNLLDGSPQLRRAFLDWGCFYHFTEYAEIYKNFKHVLKQRNALLQQKINNDYFYFWNDKYIEINEALNKIRKEYIKIFNQEVQDVLKIFLPNNDLIIELSPGFKEGNLREQLNSAMSREFAFGYSLYGCGKADIKIRQKNIDVIDILSRGQKKLLVTALKLAQGKIYSKLCGKRCAFLIDDISSELDEQNLNKLFSYIVELKNDHQFFISLLNNNSKFIKDNKDIIKEFSIKTGNIETK